MKPLESLLNRRSYCRKKLTYPAPNDQELRSLFDLVMTTPDHGNLKPWRFLVVKEENMPKLALATLEMYRQQSPDGKVTEKARRSAKEIADSPMMIIAISNVRPEHHVSLWDQQLCGGAAVQNIMNGLHLMGYGAFWYTFLAGKALKPILGMKPEDQVLGAIAVGTPIERFKRPLKRKAPDDYCFEWHGLGGVHTPLFSDKKSD